jgi:hypothetical protein
MFKNHTITRPIGIEVLEDIVFFDGNPMRFPAEVTYLRGIELVINQYGADAYLLAAQAWTDGKKYGGGDTIPEPGSIAKLPASQRIEVLYFIANTRNRKHAFGMFLVLR